MFNMKFCSSRILSVIVLLNVFLKVLIAQDVRHDLVAYQGYRIELTFPDAQNEGNDIHTTIINSGKYPVTLGIKGEKYANLQVLLEDNPAFVTNPELKRTLIRSALSKNISLAPGQQQKNIILYSKPGTEGTSPPAEYKNPENLTLGKPAKKIKKEKTPKVKKEKPAQKENPVKEVKEDLTANILPASNTFDTVNCADLVISDARIIKQSKHTIKLECTITNKGIQPAPLHHYKNTNNEDISLAAYFSASGKMTRGSVLAGGHVIKNGLDKTSGYLTPGESHTVKFDISLENSSRFLNSLIISIDSRQLLYECAENNNTFVIRLRD